MNKILKSFFGLFLGAAFSLGVAASINANNKGIVKETEAANWTSGDTIYLRFSIENPNDNWFTGGTGPYVGYNKQSGGAWEGGVPTEFTIVGGDSNFRYFFYTLQSEPNSTGLKIQRKKNGGTGDFVQEIIASKSHSNNLWGLSSSWTGAYVSASICNYHFQTPANGSVSATATNHGTITLGNEDNYIYSDWSVVLTPTPDSGYGFSHWTESKNNGSTYVAWSGDDLRTNPITLSGMSGNVYHGVSFKQYKTVYYVTNKTTATSDRIYAWTNYSTASGSKTVLEYGTWDECWAITATTNASEVFSDGIVHFRGLQNKIYKFSLFSDNFIIRYKSATEQTADYSTNNGSAYYLTGEDVNAGAAIALIETEESIRNSIPASGSIMQYSICGINQTTAQELVESYNDLSPTARDYVNASTTFTYKGDGTDAQDNISFAAIFNQLSKIASGGSKSPLLNLSFMGNDSGILVVVIVSALGILGIGAYYFFKKSKKAEE